MEWGVNEWIAVGSAALALASLVLNWLVVRRQTELQYETLRAEMDAEVIAWAHEAIDLVSSGAALARGRGIAYAPDEFRRLVFETSHKRSSFFPTNLPIVTARTKRPRSRASARPSSTPSSSPAAASIASRPTAPAPILKPPSSSPNADGC
jgi:hypothetical protein